MSEDENPRRKGRGRRRRQIEDDDDDDENKQTESKSEAPAPAPAPSRAAEDSDGDEEEKKPSKGKGRRRRGSGRRRQIEDDDDDDDDDKGGSSAAQQEEEEEDDRNTGWGNSRSGKGKRDRDAEKHKTAANWDDDAEGNDTIMVIPTLSSEDEEDLKGPDKDAIAQAPQASTMLPRTQELDEDIKSILPTATASGIDLSILTACLVPQNLILEEDEPWQFEELLQEVAIELQEEAEEKHSLMVKATGEAGADDDPNDF